MRGVEMGLPARIGADKSVPYVDGACMPGDYADRRWPR